MYAILGWKNVPDRNIGVPPISKQLELLSCSAGNKNYFCLFCSFYLHVQQLVFVLKYQKQCLLMPKQLQIAMTIWKKGRMMPFILFYE